MFRSQISVLVLASALAGCAGGDGGDINQPSGRTDPVDNVSIVSGAQSRGAAAFSPNPLTISLAGGGVVQWTNNDVQDDSYGSNGTTHNIISNDNSFTAGTVAPGSTVRATFENAGTYGYHCSIHPTMVGEVRVTP
jgi:plastocyanin